MNHRLHYEQSFDCADDWTVKYEHLNIFSLWNQQTFLLVLSSTSPPQSLRWKRVFKSTYVLQESSSTKSSHVSSQVLRLTGWGWGGVGGHSTTSLKSMFKNTWASQVQPRSWLPCLHWALRPDQINTQREACLCGVRGQTATSWM